ncbi:MAG: dephospho-CoA kinase [Gemmatimonadetes bacterium]|nr:dephospho-CoA kinase [Gemmatimonadota bacterium]MBI2537975.1 dephospho-CoA kinase [Gemmatimonadota bacterium]
MLNVALTGNAAAGKSTVARWFQEWGATLIDADELVREVERPGSPTLAEIARQFGPQVLLPDGSLDRPRLRAIVLEDPARREALNAIVHPAVQARRDQLVRAARTRGDAIVVNDIPLLFEVLDPGAFDLVVLVDAPEAVRRARLRERGLEPAEIDRLLAAQLPPGAKRGRSHIVLENRGTLDQLKRAAWDAWQTMKKRAGRR